MMRLIACDLQDLLFTINVQHDCIGGNCQATLNQPEVQERISTGRSRTVMQHTEDDKYILNIFVFHHFDELAALIPPHFLNPRQSRSTAERIQLRVAAAGVLREQNQTRETTRGAVRQARSSANAQRGAKPPAGPCAIQDAAGDGAPTAASESPIAVNHSAHQKRAAPEEPDAGVTADTGDQMESGSASKRARVLESS